MASGNDRTPGTPGSSCDREDAAPTPSPHFLAAAALDLDLEMAASAAATLGGGSSPDLDLEPDPPEVAKIIQNVFRNQKLSQSSSSSLISTQTTLETNKNDKVSSTPEPSPPSTQPSTPPGPPNVEPSIPELDVEKPFRLANLSKKLEDMLKEASKGSEPEGSCQVTTSSPVMGRLGPKKVSFDPNSKVGSVILDSDQLGVTSQSNFSTVRANTCVFKGKWVYELMLGSKGVMQVGWCTLDCKFSGEEGVGDTTTSYAYDGNRLRKWNVSMSKYGEPWLTGDVISCAIDCDEGSITFCHNGKNMGCAFSSVRLGPSIAYFPALSLSFNENVRVNFGATPLRFPLEGYSPLQPPPVADLRKAQLLTTHLEKLVDIYNRALQDEHEDVTKQRNLDARAGHLAAATGTNPAPSSAAVQSWKLSQKAICLLVGWHIFDKLSPLLKSAFITESCLVKLLLKVSDVSRPNMPQQRLHTLLDLMWSVMDPHEVETTFENILISLLTAYRFSPTNDEFQNQHLYLLLTHAVITHERTRKFLLKKVLFDKIKFPIFMHVKPPDDATLAEMVPDVWWPPSNGWKDGVCYEPMEDEEKSRKEKYDAACNQLKAKIKVLEDTQTEILKTLLTDSDGNSSQGPGVSTQYIFLYKLREFLRENLAGSRLLQFQLCPLPVILCFFHRLIAALKSLWDDFANPNLRLHNLTLTRNTNAPSTSSGEGAAATVATLSTRVPFDQAYVPFENFFDDSIQFFDSQRLGGLESHLKKTLKGEIQAAKGSVNTVGLTSNFPFLLAKLLKQDMEMMKDGGSDESKSGSDPLSSKKTEQSDEGKQKMCNALIELIDDIILMYHVGAHKQLRKMSTLRENMQGYIQNLEDSESKLKNCPQRAEDVIEELERAKKVFYEKVCEQARHMAWVSAVVYFDERQRDVCWLLNTMLRTFEKSGGTGPRESEENPGDASGASTPEVATAGATSAAGPLFAFIPDYYVEVIINAYYSLKNFFHPTVPYNQCPNWKEVLVRFAEFLSDYFRDPRIVHSDSRDSLIQALACFVCYPHSLEALESMPKQKKLMMTAHLISPYENRSWAQTNWILVRLWKGCGFGFRTLTHDTSSPSEQYTQLPHFAGRKDAPPDIASAGMQKPCPSSVFQNHVKELLEREETKAVAFLNSILNQLNWAFSEFIGMLQEIQQIAGRPERNYVDSRQLKIAATCFDLTVGLLRVLEMTVHLCPQLFVDWKNHSSAEALLSRLCQLVCQLLSRITTKTSLFDTVVAFELPGMESVDHYPILTAVTGILVELISRGSAAARDRTTQVILADPSFQISSIEYLLEEEVLSSSDVSNDASSKGTATSLSTFNASVGATGVPPTSDSMSRRSESLSFKAQLNSLSKKRKFSFHNYQEHIAPSEIQETEFLVQHLKAALVRSHAECFSPDEEDLCPICCSNAINVEFKPCRHQSCKACIMHHLMNHKECFFCKTVIDGYAPVTPAKPIRDILDL